MGRGSVPSSPLGRWGKLRHSRSQGWGESCGAAGSPACILTPAPHGSTPMVEQGRDPGTAEAKRKPWETMAGLRAAGWQRRMVTGWEGDRTPTPVLLHLHIHTSGLPGFAAPAPSSPHSTHPAAAAAPRATTHVHGHLLPFHGSCCWRLSAPGWGDPQSEHRGAGAGEQTAVAAEGSAFADRSHAADP